MEHSKAVHFLMNTLLLLGSPARQAGTEGESAGLATIGLSPSHYRILPFGSMALCIHAIWKLS